MMYVYWKANKRFIYLFIYRQRYTQFLTHIPFKFQLYAVLSST